MNGLPFWPGLSKKQFKSGPHPGCQRALCPRGKQNKSKDDKKTELIASAVSVPFLSVCLCQKAPKYLSTVGVSPRSVGIAW